MDLGPIAGIRSVSLLNAQRAKREGTPSFEIDSSARTDDEHTSNQQPPERKPDRKPHREPEREPEEDAEFVPQAAANGEDNPTEIVPDNAPDSPEEKPENGYDWFV